MGRLAFHEPVAAAGAGYAQLERLQLFVDAIAGGGGGNSRTRLNLPPFAVFAEAPLGFCSFAVVMAVLIAYVTHD